MATDMKTSRSSPVETLKVYKRRRSVRRPAVLPDEIIVFEILIRLPVKSLLRFKSVSKAWRATISDLCFIRLHLQQSAKNQLHKKPSFLITPHTLDRVIESEAWPTTFSNHIPFYSWEDGQDNACLVHSTTFPSEFGTVYNMMHCDGLVLLSTDTMVYVFNLAIHHVLKLCYGQKDVFQNPNPTVCLGLDTRTNKYKVVRFFYRSIDYFEPTYSVGMEICTIGGDDIDLCWRSVAEDPPFPINPGPPVTHFKGSLYLFAWDELAERCPKGVFRFNLEDETFSFISYPKLMPWSDARLFFIELGGELCLGQQCLEGKEVIWMLQQSGDDDSHEWVQRHVITLSEPNIFRTLSVIPNKDVLLIRSGNYLYHYDDARQDAIEVVQLDRLRYKNDPARAGGGSFDFVGRDDLFMFDMIFYTESLIPLTPAAYQDYI